jgi:hypothetical protein
MHEPIDYGHDPVFSTKEDSSGGKGGHTYHLVVPKAEDHRVILWAGSETVLKPI